MMTSELSQRLGDALGSHAVSHDERSEIIDAGEKYETWDAMPDDVRELVTEIEARPTTVELLIEESGLTAAADVNDGAMIALLPAGEHLADLAVAGGEPEEQLHLTLLYLGDASQIGDQERQDIRDGIADMAGRQPIVEAEAFAVSAFNPLGEEPCVVLICGGESLDDVMMSTHAEVDRAEVEYPAPRLPWIPHVTLAYSHGVVDGYVQLDDGNAVSLAELFDRTGLIRFDRVRVAFGGEYDDYPLYDALVASSEWPFHMAGKHNQQTHGRGGASPSELTAGRRLNAGKQLESSDPSQVRIGQAISSWANGGNDGGVLQDEMQAAVSDPTADTLGASFMRTIAAAPADAPTLHRGMIQVRPEDVPKAGDVFELGPTSFTRSTKVRDVFAAHESSDFGRPTTVHMKLKKGSRSLRIDHTDELKGTDWAKEQEHISMGKFRVTKYSEKTVSVKTRSGGMKTVTLFEVEIEQVPDTMEISIKTNKPPVSSDEWMGN